MYIAVEGCAHGELDNIYETIAESEKYSGKKIDLLICCGDFQATRNLSDLTCMAVPDKYKEMCTFYKYYSGEKVAPVLTIFIGGNHEASNHLQELSYGGWVAPNIYYLGYAGVINVGGIRIAGISGIYKGHDYLKGHYERAPYDQSSIRSVYHIRNLEVYRLKQLTGKMDIFVSHDWPQGITQYGDLESLLKSKPFFRDDIEKNQLGSPPAMELLEHHRPSYWFSAHMHCKFSALVPEKDGPRLTKFVALDKCLPKRKFLQIFEIEHDSDASMDLKYDLEWLSILYFTNHLLSVKSNCNYMPSTQEINSLVISEDDKNMILRKFNCDLRVPKNFCQTVEVYNADDAPSKPKRPSLMINHQTTEFCSTLGIDDPLALLKLLEPVSKSNDDKNSTDGGNNSIMDSSFETSFISDSISDSFSSDCLQVVVDKVCIERIPEHKSSLSPLKLPAASNDVEGEEVERSNSFKRSFEDMEEAEEQSREDSKDISKEETEGKPGSIVKQFKRRNHSIYSDSGSM